jgi:Phage protein (N4 Gp49/phage Sf6 gene 66) family
MMNHIDSPDLSDNAVERKIQHKNLNAPRVKPSDIDAAIVSTHFFTAGEAVNGGIVAGYKYPGPLDLLTFCVLVLKNGYSVTGESACASPENFDAEIGREIALANAKSKIWPLLGYTLKQRLYERAAVEPTTAYGEQA